MLTIPQIQWRRRAIRIVLVVLSCAVVVISLAFRNWPPDFQKPQTDGAVSAIICGFVVAIAILLGFADRRYSRLLRRRIEGICMTCGYDLTGNVSGTCPECGTRTGGISSGETEAAGSILSKQQLDARVRLSRALLFVLTLFAVGICGIGLIHFYWYGSSAVFEDARLQSIAYILFVLALVTFHRYSWYSRLLKAHSKETCTRRGSG